MCIVEQCIRVHELCKSPHDLQGEQGWSDWMDILEAGRPKTVSQGDDLYIVAQELKGWSKGETRRRNASISPLFQTTSIWFKWGVLKIGKNEFEPFVTYMDIDEFKEITQPI